MSVIKYRKTPKDPWKKITVIKGDRGVGVSSASVDTDGNLNLLFTDGTTHVVGRIVGTNGADGTSVVVSSVSENTSDGGYSTITFSDGSVVKVKNGNKGTDGIDGKTPVKGEDYFTPQDKEELIIELLSRLPNGDEVSY